MACPKRDTCRIQTDARVRSLPRQARASSTAAAAHRKGEDKATGLSSSSSSSSPARRPAEAPGSLEDLSDNGDSPLSDEAANPAHSSPGRASSDPGSQFSARQRPGHYPISSEALAEELGRIRQMDASRHSLRRWQREAEKSLLIGEEMRRLIQRKEAELELAGSEARRAIAAKDTLLDEALAKIKVTQRELRKLSRERQDIQAAVAAAELRARRLEEEGAELRAAAAASTRRGEAAAAQAQTLRHERDELREELRVVSEALANERTRHADTQTLVPLPPLLGHSASPCVCLPVPQGGSRGFRGRRKESQEQLPRISRGFQGHAALPSPHRSPRQGQRAGGQGPRGLGDHKSRSPAPGARETRAGFKHPRREGRGEKRAGHREAGENDPPS